MEFTQEKKLYTEIIEKAWGDAQFKAELVANPVAAIEKLTGQKVNLPAGKALLVRDQTDEETVYINIPAKSNTEDVELNEDQLEAVSGGRAVWPPIGGGGPIVTFPEIPICTTGPVSPTDLI